MPLDFRRMDEAMKLGYPAADYYGVYAVEKDEVQSVVRVLRVPYTMNDGTEEAVSAIQGVVTRREHSRAGLARKLLAEVHQREASFGNRFVMLWTGHGLVAHNLYSSMGYVDVFTPMLAMRELGPSRKRSEEYKIRPAKAGDAETIERIHSEATKGRVGFTPRAKGNVRALFRLGQVKPSSLHLVLSGEEPVAYFQVQKGPGWVRSDEVVMKPGIQAERILSTLESEYANGWLIILGTFAHDSQTLLKKQGYLITGHSYFGLLARALDKSRRNVREEIGVDRPSFTCHFLDYF